MTHEVKLPGSSYNIYIGEGAVDGIVNSLKTCSPESNTVAIVSDKNVWGHHGSKLLSIVSEAGFNVHKLILEPGEQNKSMVGLELIYNFFAKSGLVRNNAVIAFGGGVIGDLCGFAASSYMRGIPYIQVPTTLLSQVDSSVGGKTAINLSYGKNLVGSFYQPTAVHIETPFLKTLPKREWRCGMAEVIKYGAIRSKSLFEKLLENKSIDNDLSQIILECLRIKSAIVENDQFDTGERMLLNFGHTFGHAIEKKYDFNTYNHGEAVAIGMMIAAQLGEKLGYTKEGTSEAIKKVLITHEIDPKTPCAINELMPIIKMDKKADESGVNFVFLKEIGDSFYKKIRLQNAEYGGLACE